VAAAAALLAAPAAAGAAARGGAWAAFYADDNGVKVFSSALTARVEVPGGLVLEGAYETDVVTGASVDAVSSASYKEWTEVRHGLRLGASWSRDGREVGVAYLPSFEPDYVSQGFSAHAGAEWLDRRLGTRLVGGYSRDLVFGLAPIRTAWGRAELSAVLDARTLATLSYELGWQAGYISSPYLWVEIELVDPPPAGERIAHLRDTLPGARTRHALVAGLRRALGAGWFASGSYRFYLDDWGIKSHTGEAELAHTFAGGRVTLAALARLYGQSGARFWSDHYVARLTALPALFTTDKLLSPLWSGALGARSETTFPLGGATLVVTTRLELYAQRFLDYSPLDWRRAVIGSVGVALEL